MAYVTKKWVNSYLFILLKRMLFYDFIRAGEQASDSKIAAFIYDRHKRKNFKHTNYYDDPKEKDSEANERAETFRKEILGAQVYEFSRSMLDMLAKEVQRLGRYESWEHFISQFKDDFGARLADNYKGWYFSALPHQVQEKILSLVELSLVKMELHYIRDNRFENPKIIRHTKDMVIRAVTSSEIEQILKLEVIDHKYFKDAMPHITKNLGKMIKKNPNIFYVHKDDINTWGFVGLYPLRDEAVEKFMDNNHYQLTDKDIYTLEEKEKTHYIFIGDYAHFYDTKTSSLLREFPLMIREIANPDNKNLVLVGRPEGFHYVSFWENLKNDLIQLEIRADDKRPIVWFSKEYSVYWEEVYKYLQIVRKKLLER